MATTQHYIWAAGHVILLLTSFRYLLTWIMMSSKGYTWWYSTAYLGALTSYAIVVQKSLTGPSNQPLVARLLSDENVQYLLLALFWWTNKPIPISLVPYTIFSTFHVATFVRTTVLPKVFPLPEGAPPAPNSPNTSLAGLSKSIQLWVKNNYEFAMRIVAYAELVILTRVILGVLLLQNSLLVPIIYSTFIRSRYINSQFTRDAVAVAVGHLDKYAAAYLPPAVLGYYNKAKELVARSVQSTVAQPAPRRG